MTYTCHDCDATFDAPTDTDTVTCPGCGETALKEASSDPDLAESLAADVHYLLDYIGPHPHADGSPGCGHCARVAVAHSNVRTADQRPTQPAPPADPAERRIRYATQISKGGFGQSLRELTEAAISVADAEQAELRARIADYENRITWDTTCESCARVLDSSIRETERADRAESTVARVRRLHDRLATETELASPEDRITRADAAERIAAALDMQSASGPGRAAGETQQDQPGCAHCGHSQDRHMGDAHERGCHVCWDLPGNSGWAHPFQERNAEQPAAVSQPGKDA